MGIEEKVKNPIDSRRHKLTVLVERSRTRKCKHRFIVRAVIKRDFMTSVKKRADLFRLIDKNKKH